MTGHECTDERCCPRAENQHTPKLPKPEFYPHIMTVTAHRTRKDEFVIWGRESEDLDSFFTRRANGKNGAQFLGNYRMTLEESWKDFDARLSS